VPFLVITIPLAVFVGAFAGEVIVLEPPFAGAIPDSRLAEALHLAFAVVVFPDHVAGVGRGKVAGLENNFFDDDNLATADGVAIAASSRGTVTAGFLHTLGADFAGLGFFVLAAGDGHQRDGRGHGCGEGEGKVGCPHMILFDVQ